MADKRNNKVKKLRKGFRINVGHLIFVFIFIYIVVFVINYLSKDHISIYTVTDYSIADDNIFTGFIIRDEATVSTEKAGYITYYAASGSKIAKNAPVFSVNEGDKAAELIKENGKQEISENDYQNIRNRIGDYIGKFETSDFEKLYDFKTQLNVQIFEAQTNVKSADYEALSEALGKGGVDLNSSEYAGVVSMTFDNCSDITTKNITSQAFDKDSYSSTRLTTGDLVEKGAKAYRVVKSNVWSIVLKPDEKQLEKFKDQSSVKVILSKYGIELNVPVKCFERNGENFVRLSLDKYVSNYINDRYLDVEVNFNQAKGLKIPNSSITEKDFYLVPEDYITNGGNSDKPGIIMIEYDEEGHEQLKFQTTEIYYSKDNYCYIDMSYIEAGTVLVKNDSKKRYTVSEKGSLKGVYNVNEGYFKFRRIEVLYDNEDYSVVRSDTDYGLRVYDHIVSDVSTAIDEELIY